MTLEHMHRAVILNFNPEHRFHASAVYLCIPAPICPKCFLSLWLSCPYLSSLLCFPFSKLIILWALPRARNFRVSLNSQCLFALQLPTPTPIFFPCNFFLWWTSSTPLCLRPSSQLYTSRTNYSLGPFTLDFLNIVNTRHKLTDCLSSASADCGDRIGSYYMFGALLNLLVNLEFQRWKKLFPLKGKPIEIKSKRCLSCGRSTVSDLHQCFRGGEGLWSKQQMMLLRKFNS